MESELREAKAANFENFSAVEFVQSMDSIANDSLDGNDLVGNDLSPDDLDVSRASSTGSNKSGRNIDIEKREIPDEIWSPIL